MFELEIPTTARLLDVIVLSQKNRQPDENPGAKMTFEIPLTNNDLSMFDGHLKGMLYTKSGRGPDQGALDGIAPAIDMPNLTAIGRNIGTFKWGTEQTGCTLVIDLGVGGPKSDLTMTDCEMSNIRIKPVEGGTISVKLNVESPNVTEASFGKLAKLKSREVQIVIWPPEVKQADLAIVK